MDHRLVCECPGVSGGGEGQWWPAAGLGALSEAVHVGPFEGGPIFFITSTIVWAQVNNREGTHQQKIGLKSY